MVLRQRENGGRRSVGEIEIAVRVVLDDCDSVSRSQLHKRAAPLDMSPASRVGKGRNYLDEPWCPTRASGGCAIPIEMFDADAAIVRRYAPDVRLRKIERLQCRCVGWALDEDYVARIQCGGFQLGSVQC